MLDVKLVLQEAEEVLDSHYIVWQQWTSRRVQVYERPQQPAQAQPAPAALPTATNAATQTPGPSEAKVASGRATPSRSLDLGEAVTNVFLFMLLSVLSDRLTRRGTR
ncbi:MAG TPA: hypothetical protein PKE45_07650 [Caldilineaceae bacterium]|nr:hypothetical protein [Caldilineaceae bacterium]